MEKLPCFISSEYSRIIENDCSGNQQRPFLPNYLLIETGNCQQWNGVFPYTPFQFYIRYRIDGHNLSGHWLYC